MPNTINHRGISSGFQIATLSNGKVQDRRVCDELQQIRTHWVISKEGAIAIADALGTGILAASITLVLAGGFIAIAIGDAQNNEQSHEESISVSEFFVNSLLRVHEWAIPRIITNLNEAKQSVFERTGANVSLSLTFKPFGIRNMPNTISSQPHSSGVGQQLRDDDEPKCPITLNVIPLDRRAIVIHCTEGGMPAAIIYDQRALFSWLDNHHTDPETRKPIQCVVNAQGSIIYPVRVQSDFPKANSQPSAGSSIIRQVFAPGIRAMSKHEIKEQEAFRKTRTDEILKRIRSKEKRP